MKSKKILSNRNAISIVGDRFVFQSEVLFEPGKVEINQDGKLQLSEIATIILEIIEEIPSEIPEYFKLMVILIVSL